MKFLNWLLFDDWGWGQFAVGITACICLCFAIVFLLVKLDAIPCPDTDYIITVGDIVYNADSYYYQHGTLIIVLEDGREVVIQGEAAIIEELK